MQSALDVADESKARLAEAIAVAAARVRQELDVTATLLQAERDAASGRDLPELHADLEATEAVAVSSRRNAVWLPCRRGPMLQEAAQQHSFSHDMHHIPECVYVFSIARPDAGVPSAAGASAMDVLGARSVTAAELHERCNPRQCWLREQTWRLLAAPPRMRQCMWCWLCSARERPHAHRHWGPG